jgi:2-polyprenyl-3-methyl-5-hydroxy-6-metoxy-1,4-benzoquinol methylase/peptidoglycan hydrolase CwlO-like protein
MPARRQTLEGGSTTPPCWCGNVVLGDFSPSYAACAECGTLVSLAGLRPEETEVHDDDRDFYGKPYWLTRQRDELGFPDIFERSRQDLPERCLHWLRTLLAHRLPPARVLELGSGHGAFVALMRAVGFDATGLELSPWVVDFARRTFDVPVLLGPIEAQSLPERSLEAIVLNDVLEHLAHPASVIGRCAQLLTPDGLVQAQTPCYPEGLTHQQLVEASHPFLAMLQAREHLYLFSRRAVQRLFAEAGLPIVEMAPALFPYDMVVIASRHVLLRADARRRDEILLASPAARLVQALVDLDDRARGLSGRVEEIERDRQDRIAMIGRLNEHIAQTNRTVEAARRTIHEQQARLDAEDRDRLERLAMIARLNDHIEQTSGDYEARGQVIRDQQARIEEIERDRQERIAMIGRLNGHIEKTSGDYELRGRIIHDQQATIAGLHQEVAAARDTQLRAITEQHATIEKLVQRADQLGADLETLLRARDRTNAAIEALHRSPIVRLLRALRLL